jgi:hypothetical protein
MASTTLEERVAALEQAVAQLVVARSSSEGGEPGWQSTVGMFADDPVMREIQDEGQKIREADRASSQQGEPEMGE